MYQDFTDRITQYLSIETSYATIITGDYGTGKSHYIKNYLFPAVKKVKIPNTKNNEEYLPVIISLFGVKSIEEMQFQILAEVYPILKNKGVKFGGALLSMATRLYTGTNLYEGNDKPGEFIDYNKLLLCIDDIDRKSESLKIEELYGFVNNLVENQGGKVLLIANENILRSESLNNGSGYSVLKEKVIGISIKFAPKLSEVYDHVIKQKYDKTNISYLDFLLRSKVEIIGKIAKNGGNLRNLLFFIEHYKIIFNSLTFFSSKENIEESIAEKISLTVLQFSLPIAIEYKMGKLHEENFHMIKSFHLGSSVESTLLALEGVAKQKDIEELKKHFPEEYKKKYYPRGSQQRHFFESVFNYLTGQKGFSNEEFFEELNKFYLEKIKTLSEEEKLLIDLKYWECLDLKMEDYDELTRKMLVEVGKGTYTLETYPTAFQLATRFNNLLNFDINELKNSFFKGIEKSMSIQSIVKKPRFYISINETTEFADELKEIIAKCDEVYSKAQNQREAKKISEWLKCFTEDFHEFDEMISEREIVLGEFIAKTNLAELWNNIKKLKNSNIIAFAFSLQYEYKSFSITQRPAEKLQLEKLSELIETEIAKEPNKLNKVALSFLNEKIKKAL